MSVILQWENPESTFQPLSRSYRVERGNFHNILTEDAVWGVFEDLTGNDPNDNYYVFVQDGDGNQIGAAITRDLKKYVRPTNTCKVSFDFIDPDGSPNLGRKITFTNPRDEVYRKIICSNQAGHAEMFFTWGSRILIAIDGHKHSLDCIIPSFQDATFQDLFNNGSWQLSEQRGLTL